MIVFLISLIPYILAEISMYNNNIIVSTCNNSTQRVSAYKHCTGSILRKNLIVNCNICDQTTKNICIRKRTCIKCLAILCIKFSFSWGSLVLWSFRGNAVLFYSTIVCYNLYMKCKKGTKQNGISN